MIVNKGKQGCQNCINREFDTSFGLICQHKASREGIEVIKNFYIADEVLECDYYEYDENSPIGRKNKKTNKNTKRVDVKYDCL